MEKSNRMMAKHFLYWGKADTSDFHLLPYHCLDVAAVADRFLTSDGRWRQHIASLLAWREQDVADWLPFFISLHDLGKFSSAFQSLRGDIAQTLRPEHKQTGHSLRHDSLGFVFWDRTLHQRLTGRPEIPGLPPPARRHPTAIDFLIRAVTGHHGKPPVPATYNPEWYVEADVLSAESFALESASLLLPPATKWPELDSTAAKVASWWIAGFTVLCDWLGSNTLYFKYKHESVPLKAYWDEAKEAAAIAVRGAGLDAGVRSNKFSLRDCFSGQPVVPTPLQSAAADLCAVPAEPQLFILEDATGSGKTEAALVLAHRLMRQERATGIYFALPTMATANAMYARLGKVYRRLFAEGSSPSLVLAHGNARHVKEFRDSILEMGDTGSARYGDGTASASATCTAWLADNRKRALLANVGVGTVDQAMLAILHAKHQSLRLAGLLDKLLIVDEVHACDAYMLRLLESLLRAHAQSGGSAILLSATLASTQREKLVRAFEEGLGVREDRAIGDGTDYPLITQVSASGYREYPIERSSGGNRTVEVEWTDDLEDVYARLTEAAEDGRCACWIRNTVRDAREAYTTLTFRYPDLDIGLFHARFSLADRLAIERGVTQSFGAGSGSAVRAGRILVATQVIEQSLDVDFDVLISDIAPVDRLIQRAGRLQRHTRAANGDRIEGPDKRGQLELHVYGPAWTDQPDRDWLRRALPGTAAVYRSMDAHLWLTQRLLAAQGGFTAPGDLRPLMEGVFGPDAEQNVPDRLRRVWQEWSGGALADASIGSLNSIHVEGGYVSGGAWTDDAVTPTRLGEPSITLVLGKRSGDRIVSWAEDADWSLSSVQVAAKFVSEAVRPADVSEAAWQAWLGTLPAEGRWSVPVVMEQHEGAWVGSAKDCSGKVVRVIYDRKLGLYVRSSETGNSDAGDSLENESHG